MDSKDRELIKELREIKKEIKNLSSAIVKGLAGIKKEISDLE